MREILFRGKRTDNGEWVYGYPLIDNAPCTAKKKGHCKCRHDGSYAIMIAWIDDYHEYADFDVDPETVGQYTGLTDKNGTKIFEGDILSTENGTFENTGCGYIRFHNGRFVSYYGQDALDIECFDELCEVCSEREIIGNIHDNPGLLSEATP